MVVVIILVGRLYYGFFYVIRHIVGVEACCCSMGPGCSILVGVGVDVGVGVVACSLGVGRTCCYIGVGFGCSLYIGEGSLGQAVTVRCPRQPELLARGQEQEQSCLLQLLWGLFSQSATSF